MKIAIYGKGGIGKSTISANLSAALSKNSRVLQIGCDPKHDSTRLLLGCKTLETVLDYIRKTLPEERKLKDIVFKGYGNVACVEAGGPEPGVGCAGRGIISTFELLDILGLNTVEFDYVIYDVLGDVVCGGFAVPVRKQYADTIILVTSGEFMSIYAANNILRGIKKIGDEPKRVAGIIYNSRGLDNERDRTISFAKAVHLPVLISIPRSELFADSEKRGITLIEGYPESDEAKIFKRLADMTKHLELFKAYPIDDDILESVVLKQNRRVFINESYVFGSEKIEPKPLLFSENVKTKHPLHGCAFAGASCVTIQIQDSFTILHAPKSCVSMMNRILTGSFLRMNRLYGYNTNFNLSLKMDSTNMDEEDFIFGGIDKLKKTLKSAIEKGHKTIFIITACPAGIIGDDVKTTALLFMREYPSVTIKCILVDGNLVGDFSQGYLYAYEIMADFIEPVTDKVERSVNIIGEKSLATNEEYDFQKIKSLLYSLGLSINCRFVNKISTSDLKKFNRACLNLPAHGDYSSRQLNEVIFQKSNLPVLDVPFPIGFTATSKWLFEIGDFFGLHESVLTIIEAEKKLYYEKISKIRPLISDKRILISTYSRDIDWILELADDLSIDIIRIGLMYSPSNEPLSARFNDLPVVKQYDGIIREKEIKEMMPDFVLYDRPELTPNEKVAGDVIPYAPGFGFQAGIEHACRWSRLIQLPIYESWKFDGDGTF